MKKAVFLLSIILLSIATFANAQHYKDIYVPGSKTGWYPTGVIFKAGDNMAITADSNYLVYARDGKYNSDPAGLSSVKTPTDSPLAKSPFLSLVGKIGDNDPFFIGLSHTKNLTEAGELYLAVNDSMQENIRKESTGFYKASIMQGTSQAPMILKAGFEKTMLTSSENSVLTIAAEVFDPDGLNDIAYVEILLGGHGTGIKLAPIGNGIYTIDIPMFAGMAGSYLIELQAVDRSGFKSDVWPYLTFH